MIDVAAVDDRLQLCRRTEVRSENAALGEELCGRVICESVIGISFRREIDLGAVAGIDERTSLPLSG